jgi:hypothetical protein
MWTYTLTMTEVGGEDMINMHYFFGNARWCTGKVTPIHRVAERTSPKTR